MATYGIDYYDKSFYGAPVLIDYAVTNLAATQLDFGHVRISWTAPVQNVWTELSLVRSRYGFPVSISDGDLLATYSSTQASTSYDDYGLTSGYWYYGVFAAVPLEAWSAALTYQVGDRVAYESENWIAQQISINQPPAVGSYWASSNETSIWQPAGGVATMSVSDHGYAALMDSYVPNAYQATPILTTDDQVVNDDLTDFLAVLGWGFEIMNTENDDLFNLYDTSTTRFDRLLQISTMLGISIEAASSPRYQRLRTAEAAALGREKGTQAGLTALIEATTGLKCIVATGPNLMLKRDQSDFPWPLYPAWETDESYKVGDQVTYQGARYVCITWAYTAVTANFTGTPNTATTGTVSSQAYNAEVSTTANATLSASVTVPVTGTYEITFETITGSDGGVLGLTVDGVFQPLAPISYRGNYQVGPTGWTPLPGGDTTTTGDTYTSSAGLGTTYIIPLYLTAGAHAIKFTAATKNSSSSGYSIRIANLTVTAAWSQYPPNSTAPVNGATSSGLQWTAPGGTAQPGYTNEATGQVSTWSLVGATGTLIINYLGRIGLTTDTNWLSPANGPFTLSGVYEMVCAAYPVIGTYSGSAAYAAGQIVTGPTDGLQYTALIANTGVAPPAPGTWLRTNYGSPYDRELIVQSTTPIHLPPTYDPQASYAEGAQVIYNQGLYVAPAPTTGVTPPASPGDNSGWSYVGPANALAWTSSLYNPVPSTGTIEVYPGLEFYDINGQPIASAGIMSSTGTVASVVPLLARLIEPVAELNNAFIDAGNTQLTASPTGYWQVSSGTANANPGYSGSQNIKLCYLFAGQSDCCVGLTAPIGVVNSAVRDVGILFRYSDSTHFWAAMRDQIVSYNGGTKTDQQSFSRLPVGTRWFVQLSGATIKLYAYKGSSAAPTLITTVTNSFNQTAQYHGIVDWTW